MLLNKKKVPIIKYAMIAVPLVHPVNESNAIDSNPFCKKKVGPKT